MTSKKEQIRLSERLAIIEAKVYTNKEPDKDITKIAGTHEISLTAFADLICVLMEKRSHHYFTVYCKNNTSRKVSIKTGCWTSGQPFVLIGHPDRLTPLVANNVADCQETIIQALTEIFNITENETIVYNKQ